MAEGIRGPKAADSPLLSNSKILTTLRKNIFQNYEKISSDFFIFEFYEKLKKIEPNPEILISGREITKKLQHIKFNSAEFLFISKTIHRENFLAIFTILSVVIFISSGTLENFATFGYVSTMRVGICD